MCPHLLVVALLLLGGWDSPSTLPGWPLYDRLCVACHGAAGDGNGPAAPFTWGRPRAFTRGTYLWRSTSLTQPPTDDDLRTTISLGAPGSSMPAFGDLLTAVEIDQLIAIVKAFSPETFAGPAPRPIMLSAPPPRNAARGTQLFDQWCRACHGTGAGDGPSAFALAIKPYALAKLPLRRPRASDSVDVKRAAAARSIATGLAGTPMGMFHGHLTDDEIWALADHILEINARTRNDRRTLDPDATLLDQAAPIAPGMWPGSGERSPFASTIEPQGPPPASLAPAQASVDAQQCARCHIEQLREWGPSVHRGSARSIFIAGVAHGIAATERAVCLSCHAPLPEQAADEAPGVTCAGCHLRAWTRFGPPEVTASLLPLASYPLVTLPIYERSDFCMPCHQLPPRTAVAGKPPLDTYREWLESPYMRRGLQCQHCHMPNREHTFLGIHDPVTVRQAIELTASSHRTGDGVTVVASLRNVGAGHALPTTATPIVILRIELFDGEGRAIVGARSELRIGRELVDDIERSDTRIFPGDKVTMARAWTAGRTHDATIARVTIEVAPDASFEQRYSAMFAESLAPAQRSAIEQALARARASHYVAEQRDVAISP